MNKAQIRTWYPLTISVAGIAFGAAAFLVIRIMHLDITNAEHHIPLRLLGSSLTIPLVAMVILSWRLPAKEDDERDKAIDQRSMYFGYLGAFGFLGVTVLVSGIVNPSGSMQIYVLPTLVYFAYFVGVMVSSVASLLKYGRESMI